MTACSSAVDGKIALKYGKGSVEMDLSGAASVSWLYGSQMPVIDDLAAAFRRAVEGEAAGEGLKARLAPRDEITIIISDITRFWMRQDRVCELLVRYLHEECGIAMRQMVVVVALGTHRPMTEAELKQLASAYVYENVRVVNHDCDAADLQYVGTTSFGNRVEVNPLAVGRKVITISGTVHHLMAGYGGGRKSILPGISARHTIRYNHSMALDPDEARSNSLIGSGKLKKTPFTRIWRKRRHWSGPPLASIWWLIRRGG